MFSPMLAALLPFAVVVHAQLIQQVWENSAFAPAASAVETLVPSLNVSSLPGTFPALCTARFSGTISATMAQLFSFSIVSDGSVRLFIDEHLVVDAPPGINRSAPGAAPQRYASFLNIPLPAGTPLPLRLEYSRWGSPGPATLQLWWSGNATVEAVVPPSAFAPTLSNFLRQRSALRDRLEVPRIPWQTYSMTSMAAHVLMPAGFAVSATLAVAGQAGKATTLGRVVPFRNNNPALVQPGLRSINGSDYTILTVSRWAPAGNASVTFETTVVNGSDLAFLATCAGSDCSNLTLVVEPFMMAERAGVLTAGASGRTLHADLPGFAPVTVSPLGGCAEPVPWDCGGAGAPAPCLALPLGDGAGAATGFWTGAEAAAPSTSDARMAIGAAQAAVAQEIGAAYGELAPLWEGLCSAAAWNTVFTPYEGVITPVSHLMGDIWGMGFILFEWDSYFFALMASLQAGTARDLGYATLIQVSLGRTLMGFVPNGGAGPRRTYDRSEDQVGALVLKAVVDKTGDAWLLEGLLPVMLTWNDWVWRRRRGEGVLAGPDGFADLMCLGSDPSLPRSDVQGTLQAARYEGMDNSAIYDAPPANYSHATGHMNVYDVAATALFASDTEAAIALCSAVAPAAAPPGCTTASPPLQQRLDRVRAAMNAHMWSPSAGLYANTLFNGTQLGVFAPTSVFPMLSGAASDAQAEALAGALASPRGFCYNASHTPSPTAEMLVQWGGRAGSSEGGHRACVTPACTAEAIFDRLSIARIEAVVLLPSASPPFPGMVALHQFRNPATGAVALVDGEAPPDASFSEHLGQEGWAWAAPPPLLPLDGGGVGVGVGGGGGGWAATWPATTNLSLWHSAAAGAYATCGTGACASEAAAQGFAFLRTMGYAYNGTGPDNTPCKVGGASVARADPSFEDQEYWRGRAWGPHHMLVYWALARYDHVPAARAVRADLVAMGAKVQLENWAVGVVCENINGVVGTCEDSGNADPFYTWGALFGFTSFIEKGLW
jgi:hypothetical protein